MASKQRESLLINQSSPILIQYRDNMYKKNFKKWNTRKNNDEREMEAIVRKRAERARVGKASTFEVRGKVKDFQEVSRYWERKDISLDIVALRAMSRTPEAVKCFTPLQSPLRTPEVLAIPERILVELQDYITGSFEAGKWTHDREAQSLDLFHNQCGLAITLFNHNRGPEAWQTLRSTFITIEKFLRSENISTFRILLRTTLNMFKRRNPDIALAILRQVSDMAEVWLGKSHPFRVVCMSLESLRPTDYSMCQDVWAIALQRLGDCFGQVLGQMNGEALHCHLDFIIYVEAERNVKGAERMLRKLLLDYESSLGKHSHRTLEVHRDLALNLYEQRKFIEAEEAYRTILACLPPSSRSYLKQDCLHDLASSQYMLGDTQGAVATLRETIHLCQSGRLIVEDSGVCVMMLDLEKWLTELGDFDSAAEVEETRLKMQDSMNVEDL